MTERKQQNGRHNPTLSVITLNINGLNPPIKRQKLEKWIKKNPPYAVYVRHSLDPKIDK